MYHLTAVNKTTPSAVTVGAISTLVIAANPQRTYLRLTNLGAQVIAANLGAAAVAGQGIVLAAAGAGSPAPAGIWDSAQLGILPTGAVYAICASGNQSLAVVTDAP